MNSTTFNRRKFLASGSALIPLPFLESFMAGPAAAAAVAPEVAKRMVFLGIGFGVTRTTWFPDVSSVGSDYALPPGLEPLAKHKEDFSIIQNLYHQYSRDGHSGSTFWLTGANPFQIPGKSFHNTVSVDQVAAAEFGKQTRFTSLQLAGKGTGHPGAGHGRGLSLSWNQQGKPMSAYETPLAAFNRLFSNTGGSEEEQRARMAEQRSVLDTVLADARSVKTKINQHDKQKLDEYFDSIRDIETRIAKEEKWVGVPPATPPNYIKEPAASLEGKEEIKIIYDLMAAALQVDATRVISYRMPADTLLRSLGVAELAHQVSHAGDKDGRNKEVSQIRDKAHSEMLGGFFDRLKSIDDGDGKNLFDNSTIAFGSNISYLHTLTNCPTLIAGGGAGVKQGQHLVMENTKTPLCNLWLSLLQGSGIQAESFGDSTGVIEELF